VKPALVFGLTLFALSDTTAATRLPVIPATELARALAEAGRGKVAVKDIRVRFCSASEDEPTEFECHWDRRTAGGWKAQTTWVAIDGKGWHVID
jgi:hypothetical protein